MRRNNNKVDSSETGRIVNAHLLPWFRKMHECHDFVINDDKILSSLLSL